MARQCIRHHYRAWPGAWQPLCPASHGGWRGTFYGNGHSLRIGSRLLFDSARLANSGIAPATALRLAIPGHKPGGSPFWHRAWHVTADGGTGARQCWDRIDAFINDSRRHPADVVAQDRRFAAAARLGRCTAGRCRYGADQFVAFQIGVSIAT